MSVPPAQNDDAVTLVTVQSGSVAFTTALVFQPNNFTFSPAREEPRNAVTSVTHHRKITHSTAVLRVATEVEAV